MLELQAKNNDLTFPTWRTANLKWNDAIMVEAVEAFDSVPWKWWKHSEADIANLQTELVDMWHFIMSLSMVKYGDSISADELNVFNNDIFTVPCDHEMIKTYLKDIIRECSKLNIHEVDLYFLMSNFTGVVGMSFDSFDDFVKLYIAKNALNGFRQSRGYKDGTYIKVWSIKDETETIVEEDNFFIHMFIHSNPMTDVDTYMADLLEFLGHIYDTHVDPKKTRVEVASSNLQAVELSGTDCTVHFKNGTAYRYADVTKDQFNDLVGAESVGTHFNKVFKPAHPIVEKL